MSTNFCNFHKKHILSIGKINFLFPLFPFNNLIQSKDICLTFQLNPFIIKSIQEKLMKRECNLKKIFIFTFTIFLSILNLNSSNLDKIGIHKITHCYQIIIHKAYTLSYSEKHEQTKWVVYKLTDYIILNGKFKKINNFRIKPYII